MPQREAADRAMRKLVDPNGRLTAEEWAELRDELCSLTSVYIGSKGGRPRTREMAAAL